ncbi:MAG TPA: type I-E CRISPR-associated protein Cas5/CasD [Candidatus Tenderia sp.]|nr:type I-E CRISPR-associated protein Cas5/CasD [Candidatus Tenderia sp.]
MREFLLFRLYGPLAAWGEVAVGENRPSASHPSKSALLGLVAAALGIKRDQEAQLKALNSGFCLGVRVDAAGELLRDYHTAQVPPQRRKVTHYTRGDELRGEGLYTILSSRDYRTDSYCSIALWPSGQVDSFSLAEIQAALLQPKLSLYLGRKSCPLGLPMAPRLLQVATLKQAFDQYDEANELLMEPITGASVQRHYYWEQLDAEQAGISTTMRFSRRDQLTSRQRWQFSERDEFYFSEQHKEVPA